MTAMVITTVTFFDASNTAVASIKTSNLELIATLFDRANTDAHRCHLEAHIQEREFECQNRHIANSQRRTMA